MKLSFASCLMLAAVSPWFAFGQDYSLGSKVTAFTVQDLTGKLVSFASTGGVVTVVTFISTQCPVSNAYDDRMSAVYRDYSTRGVKFVFVNANQNESAREVADHAKSVGFPFPVYKDSNSELADRFDAQVTPQSYVLDAAGTLVYRGQVDDNRNEARAKRKTLRMALDAVLEGKPVPVSETKAFGCSIKRAKRSS